MSKKPKRANLKGPGKCIFCGGSGLTHEHMWADWLKAYIPREMSEHRLRFALVSPDDPPDVTIQRRTGDPHSRRIRRVCDTCNNGWMSQLQESAKPFIIPMLHGKRTRLHRKAQRILSAWIAMTTMVAEYLHPGYVAVSQADRAWLRETSTAPKYWRIWVGRHSAEQHPLYSHNTLEFGKESERPPPNTPANPNTQTTTMCVGEYFVFHVISTIPVGWDIVRRWPLPRPIAGELGQVWPIRSGTVTWPRQKWLTDSGMTLLADQFIAAAQRVLRRVDASASPPLVSPAGPS